MRSKPITIGSETVLPGESKLIELPVASLYTNTIMHLPVHVIHGREAGPRLLVSAAIHGDELNGVDIIRRLLGLKRLKNLRGTIVAIPFVNGFGMLQHSRYLPDRRDLNRSFPGSEKGPLASRLAHIFLQQIVKDCDFGVDLHTGAIHRSNLPQIRANLDDEQTRLMAEAFGVPVLLNSNLRDGSLRQSAGDYNVKILLYEAGEALRLDELSIRSGVNGLVNVMCHLKMLPKRSPAKRKLEPYIARSSVWVRAPQSGIVHDLKSLGDRVGKNEVLGVVSDPSNMFSPNSCNIVSTAAGIVVGRSNIPLVNEGDALFHVARFEDADDVAAELDVFQQDFIDRL